MDRWLNWNSLVASRYNAKDVQYVFAALSFRLSLDVCLQNPRTLHLRRTAVNSYMRVVISMDHDTGVLETKASHQLDGFGHSIKHQLSTYTWRSVAQPTCGTCIIGRTSHIRYIQVLQVKQRKLLHCTNQLACSKPLAPTTASTRSKPAARKRVPVEWLYTWPEPLYRLPKQDDLGQWWLVHASRPHVHSRTTMMFRTSSWKVSRKVGRTWNMHPKWSRQGMQKHSFVKWS